DSQFILAAYMRWGDDCVDHLLGDFAFVIWNPRTRQLFCARDHLGVRPFYYYQSNDVFVFASSAQAVVAASMVPERINEERVADFLTVILEGVNQRCTFFQDVWRLPPACTAGFANTGLHIRTYWQPEGETEVCLASDEAYTDALEEVLGAAIQARLRSHLPPASMLSGGIDSSTIVGMARDLLAPGPVRLRTYSGVSDDESDCRESQNIRRVTEQGGLEPHFVRPSEVANFAAQLSEVSARIEDPFDSRSTLMQLMYLSAHARGSVAVMDGLDGDGIASLTSGYPSYLLKAGHWIHAHREIVGLPKNYYQSQYPLWRGYWDAFKPLLAPRVIWHRRWEAGFQKMAQSAAGEAFISTDLAQRVDLASRFREYYSHRGPLMFRTLRHAHTARVMVPYLTAAVERYGRLAAYCGVEQRHPLLDKRVVEFFLALPWRQNVRNGWSKFTLRCLAERVAPHKIAWRQGSDHISWKFLESWQRLNRPAMDHLVKHHLTQLGGYMDIAVFRAALDETAPAQPYGEKGQVVFYLLKWLNTQQRQGAEAANRYKEVG
ncbi:MAG TPA: asparagine synthase-related protein, partial [Xanthomonadales bacterium]|nr:asparagine synthase-related protein [Xanthomonadales bacterium]